MTSYELRPVLKMSSLIKDLSKREKDEFLNESASSVPVTSEVNRLCIQIYL